MTGGKSYYAAGMFVPLMAAGALRLDAWLDRGRRTLRRVGLAAAGAASLAITILLVLPVLPAATFATSPIPDVYKESAEQLGWPELVATVGRVVDGLPAEQRARAVILTDNYGEAGALELLGSGLPPVYSGHNAYADWGPPPVDRTTAVVVTHSSIADFSRYWDMGACSIAGRVDNGIDLDNQEQGVRVWVCPDVPLSWSALWPAIRHLD